MNEALDRCGYPVSERDIQLLENEIKQATVYIKQARDLSKAAKDGGKGLNEQQEDEDKDKDEADEDEEDVEKRDSRKNEDSSPRQFEVSANTLSMLQEEEEEY